MYRNQNFPKEAYTWPKGPWKHAQQHSLWEEGKSEVQWGVISHGQASVALWHGEGTHPLFQGDGNGCSHNDKSFFPKLDTGSGSGTPLLCWCPERVIIGNDIFTPFSQHCYWKHSRHRIHQTVHPEENKDFMVQLLTGTLLSCKTDTAWIDQDSTKLGEVRQRLLSKQHWTIQFMNSDKWPNLQNRTNLTGMENQTDLKKINLCKVTYIQQIITKDLPNCKQNSAKLVVIHMWELELPKQ